MLIPVRLTSPPHDIRRVPPNIAAKLVQTGQAVYIVEASQTAMRRPPRNAMRPRAEGR